MSDIQSAILIAMSRAPQGSEPLAAAYRGAAEGLWTLEDVEAVRCLPSAELRSTIGQTKRADRVAHKPARAYRTRTHRKTDKGRGTFGAAVRRHGITAALDMELGDGAIRLLELLLNRGSRKPIQVCTNWLAKDMGRTTRTIQNLYRQLLAHGYASFISPDRRTGRTTIVLTDKCEAPPWKKRSEFLKSKAVSLENVAQHAKRISHTLDIKSDSSSTEIHPIGEESTALLKHSDIHQDPSYLELPEAHAIIPRAQDISGGTAAHAYEQVAPCSMPNLPSAMASKGSAASSPDLHGDVEGGVRLSRQAPFPINTVPKPQRQDHQQNRSHAIKATSDQPLRPPDVRVRHCTEDKIASRNSSSAEQGAIQPEKCSQLRHAWWRRSEPGIGQREPLKAIDLACAAVATKLEPMSTVKGWRKWKSHPIDSSPDLMRTG